MGPLGPRKASGIVVTDIIEEEPTSGFAVENRQRKTFTREATARVVDARGTEEGLILRIDGRAEWSQILADLDSFLEERRNFLDGGAVSVEWLDRLPTKEQSLELETKLRTDYGVAVIGRRKKPDGALMLREKGELPGEVQKGVAIPLFDKAQLGKPTGDRAEEKRKGQARREMFTRDRSNRNAADEMPQHENFESEFFIGAGDERGHDQSSRNWNRVAQVLGDDLFYDEEANAKVVYGTLRSGQRVETPYSLLIVGDVNPGADIVAGGDIVVFGSLRGTAHASAYNDDGTSRVIIALQMRPMQLRIGSVISRGSGEAVSGAEIARIEDRRIIVESFNARAAVPRRLR